MLEKVWWWVVGGGEVRCVRRSSVKESKREEAILSRAECVQVTPTATTQVVTMSKRRRRASEHVKIAAPT